MNPIRMLNTVVYILKKVENLILDLVEYTKINK